MTGGWRLIPVSALRLIAYSELANMFYVEYLKEFLKYERS